MKPSYAARLAGNK